MHLQLWNTYVENVMNTILAQPEINFAFDEKNKILAGIQYVYQHSSGNGGNVDPLKRYYEKATALSRRAPGCSTKIPGGKQT